MPYVLYMNQSGRDLPAKIDSDRAHRIARRSKGESIGYDQGGDILLLLDADGNDLAIYTYKSPHFSTEAYLND